MKKKGQKQTNKQYALESFVRGDCNLRLQHSINIKMFIFDKKKHFDIEILTA